MEADKNPMPQFDLLPRLSKLGHFLFDQFRSAGISSHNRGGGPALDRALYDRLHETHDGITNDQLELPYGTHEQAV